MSCSPNEVCRWRGSSRSMRMVCSNDSSGTAWSRDRRPQRGRSRAGAGASRRKGRCLTSSQICAADVAIGYFDASALVKLLVEEPGSDLAARVWDESDAVATSRISYPEVAAALAAAKRAGRLTAAGARRARSDWDAYWAGSRVVEVTREVAVTAAALVDAHVLGGADAVHLASARLFGRDALMVAWDRRLHAAARAVGLAICPPEIGPPSPP